MTASAASRTADSPARHSGIAAISGSVLVFGRLVAGPRPWCPPTAAKAATAVPQKKTISRKNADIEFEREVQR